MRPSRQNPDFRMKPCCNVSSGTRAGWNSPRLGGAICALSYPSGFPPKAPRCGKATQNELQRRAPLLFPNNRREGELYIYFLARTGRTHHALPRPRGKEPSMLAGRMMDFPLTLTHLLQHAKTFYGRSEIVSRLPDKSLRRV